MRQIGEPRTFTADNALGRSVTQTVTEYEVERSDVNKRFPNHGGLGHSVYQITYQDIGRMRSVYTSPGHTFWVWNP